MGNGGTPLTYNCPECQSSFLEEVERNSSILNTTLLNSTFLSSSILRTRTSVLNNEQSRRLSNAAIMLRLLERQLRNELDGIQNGQYSMIFPFLSVQCNTFDRKLRPKYLSYRRIFHTESHHCFSQFHCLVCCSHVMIS